MLQAFGSEVDQEASLVRRSNDLISLIVHDQENNIIKCCITIFILFGYLRRHAFRKICVI